METSEPFFERVVFFIKLRILSFKTKQRFKRLDRKCGCMSEGMEKCISPREIFRASQMSKNYAMGDFEPNAHLVCIESDWGSAGHFHLLIILMRLNFIEQLAGLCRLSPDVYFHYSEFQVYLLPKH